MNYHNENVARDLLQIPSDKYTYGEWISYSDDWSHIVLHADQTKALVHAVLTNANVVYLPNEHELHAYVAWALEGPTK